MGNIRKQIEKGYADLRRSEKLAADYVLEHMEQIPDLSIDRLAHNAGVSQPTVLRMLRSAGFSGYRDFCYRLVAELAKKAGARTIAVTNFKDAAISRYADILICTSQEQLMYGDAIFSRSCQILVVDMIYMGIISLDYDRFTDRLKRCEKVVQEKAYGGNALGKD